MTWQRIDEKTYIDDTLVTCAEYQLFIDEMREQGKYYQPDHWISYQFPKGQAREPILGVRHSDAVAFCEWLTKREDGEWKFCLPIQNEARAFLIKPTGLNLIGYWNNEHYQFTWVGTVPNNPRVPKNTFNFTLNPTYDPGREEALELEEVLELAKDPASFLALDIILTFGVFSTLDHNLDQARLRHFESACTRIIARAHDRSSNRALSIALDLVRSRLHDHNHNEDRERTLGIYIDLVTLRERIARRSPAFEGIRLVKERIR